jgi:CRISPR/Cas system CSM-associated protein Csm3 (group 7 of RAMP superfamily)
MASFTYAARYDVTAVCETPLRTSGADGDTERVLRTHSGQAFLQGSSLSGAMKDWLFSERPREAVDALFGSQSCSGHLVVSDGLFDADADMQLRPRLRIDGTTGSAAKGGKFDIAHIAAGSIFRFSLTWMSPNEAPEELDDIEGMLSALNIGEICLGAQKNNGFGRVRLEVHKRLYDMKAASDRMAWMQAQADGAPLTLSARHTRKEIQFSVCAHVDSILVKAAAVEQEENGSYTPNLMEGGVAILPGSSVKGAVRGRVKMIAEYMGLGHMTDEIFGRDSADGDNGKKGLLRFEDVRLSSENRQKITRIRIDRFTGGVMRPGMFREEPLSSDVDLRISAPADQPAACALLTYALRDLGLGLYNLGSGNAIGRGYLSVEQIKMTAPDGRQACLRFDKGRGCTAEDDAGLLREWAEKLEADRV